MWTCNRVAWNLSPHHSYYSLCMNFWLKAKWLLFHTLPIHQTYFFTQNSRWHWRKEILYYQDSVETARHVPSFSPCAPWSHWIGHNCCASCIKLQKVITRGQHYLEGKHCYREISAETTLSHHLVCSNFLKNVVKDKE